MKINNITIRSFGLFRNFSTTFEDGVNIIEGANETGKSTLVAFIKYMLFGFGEEGGILSEKDKRINWITNDADGSMTVTLLNGKQYRIDRKTTRTKGITETFYTESLEVIDLENGKNSLIKNPGQAFFGIEKDFFESTAFLDQLTVDGPADDAILQSIENLMFSGDEKLNTQNAIDQLTEAKNELLSEDEKTGRIPELKARINSLNIRLVKSLKAQKELMKIRGEVDEASSRREESAAQLAKIQHTKVDFKNYTILRSFEKLRDLKKESEDLKTQTQSYVEGNSFQAFFPTEEYASEIAQRRHVYEDARKVYLDNSDELQALEDKQIFQHDLLKSKQRADKHGGEQCVIERHNQLKKSFVLFLSLTIAFSVLFLGFLVFGVREFIIPNGNSTLSILFSIFAGVFAVAAIVFLILSLRKGEAERTYCNDYGARNGKEFMARMKDISECKEKETEHLVLLNQSRENTDRARKAFVAARSVLNEVVSAWGKILPTDEEVQSFLDIFEGSIRDCLNRKNELDSKQNMLFSNIELLSTTLAPIHEEQIRASLSDALCQTLSETSMEKIDEGIRYYEGQLRYFDEVLQTKKDELQVLYTQTENPSEISELVSSSENELEQLQNRYDAIHTALTALVGADIRLRAELAPKLAHYARELMTLVTSGKYSNITVDENLHLQFGEDGNTRTVEYLSGGTRDVAYMTLRLALVRLLYKETPPISFDESFAHQDNDRCQAMLSVLVALCKKDHLQAFVCTCRSREYDIAKQLSSDYVHVTRVI